MKILDFAVHDIFISTTGYHPQLSIHYYDIHMHLWCGINTWHSYSYELKKRTYGIPKSLNLSPVRRGCDHHDNSHHNFLTTASTRIHLMPDLWRMDLKYLSGPFWLRCSAAIYQRFRQLLINILRLLINHLIQQT